MHEELFIEMCLEIAYQLHSLSVNCYFKNEENKIILQEIYDFNFRQLELSIREIGYGDLACFASQPNFTDICNQR